MKVYIGPYLNYIGPYQISNKILFFTNKETKEKFGDWLSGIKVLDNFFVWLDKKRCRKINIHIDKYDVWSMDHTLALIIVPLLKTLKEKSNTYPNSVENKDVPRHLRTTRKEEEYEDEHTVFVGDSKRFKKWVWLLDEIIWTFEQHLNDDWHDLYIKGEIDFQFEKKENELTSTLVAGPNHTCTIDREGMVKHRKRMLKGRMLFAKYYEHFWD
jgi:hypothetical protein